MAIVVTSGISDPRGGSGAFTVADTGGATDSLKRNLTYTGDGVKSGMFIVRERLMATTRQNLRVFDIVLGGGTDVYDAQINAWVAGVPTIVDNAGTTLGLLNMFDGFVGVVHKTDSVVAANLHEIHIEPAPHAPAEVGSIDVYRINAFNAVVPGAMLDASAAMLAEVSSWTYKALPQTQTILLRMVDRGASKGVGSERLFTIGDDTTDGLRIDAGAAAGFRVGFLSGSSLELSTLVGASIAYDDAMELLVELDATDPDAAFATITAYDTSGVIIGSPASTSALALPGVWDALTIELNSDGAGGNQAMGEYRDCRIESGLPGIAFMRSLF